MNFNKLFLVASVFLFVFFPVLAQDLPPALQKIKDYNNQATMDFSVKVSFLIAFVAGVLGILSPCILPFLPAYFSFTFKEKKNITLMTFVFFFGFSLTFTVMGLVAGFLGQQSLIFLQSSWLMFIVGSFIVFMGVLSLTGKGFTGFIKKSKSFGNDFFGTFSFGVFFALGWTACLGPILAGILGIGAILGNPLQSSYLLFFYSLGNLVPLFLLSVLYDKINLRNSKWIKGRMLKLRTGNKTFEVHSTNLISALLFIFLGLIIIFFNGTSYFNDKDFFNTKQYFYSIQNWLIDWQYANHLGLFLFVSFLLIVYFSVKDKIKLR